VNKSEALRLMTEEALAKGDLARASQLSSRMFTWLESDYVSVLKMGLSSKKPALGEMAGRRVDYLFDQVFSPRIDNNALLRSHIDSKAKSASTAMASLATLSANPAVRKMIGEDPEFAPFRKVYNFRVQTGLEAPVTVANIKLPQVSAGSH